MSQIEISKVRFDKTPFVTNGLTKHYATAKDGTEVVFYMKNPLPEGDNVVTIYHKPFIDEQGNEYVKKDKYDNVQLKSASLTPHEDKPKGSNKGGYSKGGKSNYNQVQGDKFEYERLVRDPRLTVQGLMSNYTQVYIAAITNGKTTKDAENICDEIFDKAVKDAEKLQELVGVSAE